MSHTHLPATSSVVPCAMYTPRRTRKRRRRRHHSLPQNQRFSTFFFFATSDYSATRSVLECDISLTIESRPTGWEPLVYYCVDLPLSLCNFVVTKTAHPSPPPLRMRPSLCLRCLLPGCTGCPNKKPDKFICSYLNLKHLMSFWILICKKVQGPKVFLGHPVIFFYKFVLWRILLSFVTGKTTQRKKKWLLD